MRRSVGLGTHSDEKARCGTAQAVLDALEEGPARASALADRVDVHLTTALYHLRRLREGRLVREENGLWFLPSDPPEDDPRLHGAGPAGTELVRTLQREGRMNCTEAAERLGRSKPAISQLVSRLEEENLIDVRREGRAKILAPRI